MRRPSSPASRAGSAVHAHRHAFAGRLRAAALDGVAGAAGQRRRPPAGAALRGRDVDVARGAGALPRHAGMRRACTMRRCRDDPLAESLPAQLHRLPHARIAAARPQRQRRARAAEIATGLLRRHGHARRAALRHLEGRHARALLRGLAQGRHAPTAATRRCSTATAASRSPQQPRYSGGWGSAWYAAAACWWWPTSAAAASSAPAGTRPR